MSDEAATFFCSLICTETFSKAVQEWGHLEIVCNNAGVLDEDDWYKTLNVNMVRQFQGHIYRDGGCAQVRRKLSVIL